MKIKHKKTLAVGIATLMCLLLFTSDATSQTKPPTLSVHETGDGDIKLEWSTELHADDVIISTSFEDGEGGTFGLTTSPAPHSRVYKSYYTGVPGGDGNYITGNHLGSYGYNRSVTYQSEVVETKWAEGERNYAFFRNGGGSTSTSGFTSWPRTRYIKFIDGHESLDYLGQTQNMFIDGEDFYTGSKSMRIERTTPFNGPPQDNRQSTASNFQRTWYTNILGISTGTNLALNMKIRTTDEAEIRARGYGGTTYKSRELIGPGGLPFIVTKPAVIGDSKIYVTNLSQIPEDFMGTLYVTTRVGTGDDDNGVGYGTRTINDINKAAGYIILSGPITSNWPIGYRLNTHSNATPVPYPTRVLNTNGTWETLTLSDTVRYTEGYDVINRGIRLLMDIRSEDQVFIDDVQFGYASRATLFRDNKVIYEGYLSEYHDKDARDTAAPSPVSGIYYSVDENNLNITFDAAEDNGTEYTYTIRSTSRRGNRSYLSEPETVEIKSGVKGYSYVIDKRSNTIPNNIVNTTGTSITKPLTKDGIYYLHIKAIDNEGNVSETRHIKLDDIDPPTLVLGADISELTNQDVVIIAKANDDFSGIRRITLPNGNQFNRSEVNFTVNSNGIYSFTAEDFAGNQVTETIEVSNIDKIKPLISLRQHSLGLTQAKITATITDNIEVARMRWDKGFKNTEHFKSAGNTITDMDIVVSENGTYSFFAEDTAGNTQIGYITISTISPFGDNSGGNYPPSPPSFPDPPSSTVPNDNKPFITMDIPAEGTHYAVSNDNITWSEWKLKPTNTDKVAVDIQPGEGQRNAYIKTATLSRKKIPVFNGSHIEYIETSEFEVLNVYSTNSDYKIIDHTPPTIKINSEDGLFVARDGTKELIIDVTDNLDKTPKVILEVFATDENRRRRVNPLFTQQDILPMNRSQIRLRLDNLTVVNNGTKQPYHVRVEAIDANGNSTVETVIIYPR